MLLASCIADTQRLPWIADPNDLLISDFASGQKELILGYKHKMHDELPKIYRQELLNNLFNQPLCSLLMEQA